MTFILLVDKNFTESILYDWIWEKEASMHDYKYLEILIYAFEVLYLRK